MFNVSPDLDLNLRRSILQPKPGTRIPGYTGHRPGLRFGFGGTYGEMTHLMAHHQAEDYEEAERRLAACAPSSVMRRWQESGRQGERRRPRMFHVPDPKNDSTVMGQLLRGEGGPSPLLAAVHRGRTASETRPTTHVAFKSGYTGYVPRLRDQLGSNYAESAHEARRQFQADRAAQASNQLPELMGSLAAAKYGIAANFPPLVAVVDDDHVRHLTDSFKSSRIKNTQRHAMEAPVVGYQGHIPRLQPTSLGKGYAEAARQGLQHFQADQQQQQGPDLASDLENLHRESSGRPPRSSARPRTSHPLTMSQTHSPDELVPAYGGGAMLTVRE